MTMRVAGDTRGSLVKLVDNVHELDYASEEPGNFVPCWNQPRAVAAIRRRPDCGYNVSCL